MKAVEIVRPGGPEVLVLTDRPTPAPGPGEVLIKVAAAGINRPDVFQRAGNYPPPPGASDLPGLEVAGEIVDAGPCDQVFSNPQSSITRTLIDAIPLPEIDDAWFDSVRLAEA